MIRKDWNSDIHNTLWRSHKRKNFTELAALKLDKRRNLHSISAFKQKTTILAFLTLKAKAAVFQAYRSAGHGLYLTANRSADLEQVFQCKLPRISTHSVQYSGSLQKNMAALSVKTTDKQQEMFDSASQISKSENGRFKPFLRSNYCLKLAAKSNSIGHTTSHSFPFIFSSIWRLRKIGKTENSHQQ